MHHRLQLLHAYMYSIYPKYMTRTKTTNSDSADMNYLVHVIHFFMPQLLYNFFLCVRKINAIIRNIKFLFLSVHKFVSVKEGTKSFLDKQSIPALSLCTGEPENYALS